MAKVAINLKLFEILAERGDGLSVAELAHITGSQDLLLRKALMNSKCHETSSPCGKVVFSAILRPWELLKKKVQIYSPLQLLPANSPFRVSGAASSTSKFTLIFYLLPSNRTGRRCK
jgi:hypothetical protein